MNNLDSALVELAAKWRERFDDDASQCSDKDGAFLSATHRAAYNFADGLRHAADELDTLRTRLAGGGDDGRDAVASQLLHEARALRAGAYIGSIQAHHDCLAALLELTALNSQQTGERA